MMHRKESDEQNISEGELIRRCSGGEIRAQELLYRRFFSFAMSVCIRYTRNEDEAMEAVNDSFMKVLDNLSEFAPARSFKTWYGRILINTAIDYYRRNVKNSLFISADAITDCVEKEPEIEAELSAEDILNLFTHLPEQYKITFNLFEIEGYSHEEIGNMLGITESTSRSNLARAKKMLRELYFKYYTPVKKNHEAV